MVEIIEKLTVKDTGTLAINTAVELSTTMSQFDAPILLTYARIAGVINWPNVVDILLIGLAYGDATIAQIASAILDAVTTITDTQRYRENQTSQRAIIDCFCPPPADIAATSTAFNWTPRLPKGGLPAGKGSGFKYFAFNMSATANFSNGPTIFVLPKWIFAVMK